MTDKQAKIIFGFNVHEHIIGALQKIQTSLLCIHNDLHEEDPDYKQMRLALRCLQDTVDILLQSTKDMSELFKEVLNERRIR